MTTKSKYWAVKQHKIILFEGTFSDCWNHLMTTYSKLTLKELDIRNIHIARIK